MRKWRIGCAMTSPEQIVFFIFLFILKCFAQESDAATSVSSTVSSSLSPLQLNATLLENGTVIVEANNQNTSFTSGVKGYKLYFTANNELTEEDIIEWQSIELLSNQNYIQFPFNPSSYPRLKQYSGPLRMMATIVTQSTESEPSAIVTIGASKKSFISIESINPFPNGTLSIKFSTSEAKFENVTLHYKSAHDESAEWAERIDLSIDDGRVNFDLPANRTYDIQLRIPEAASSEEEVFVNATERLPSVSITEGSLVSMDPDPTAPLTLKCSAHDPAPINMYWRVNGVSLEPDHIFYTVHTVLSEDEGTSTISAKATTRSDVLTCVAVGVGGESETSTRIEILGPGAPPNMITLTAEKTGWIDVRWQEPTLPNGNITKYVLYYSSTKDLPLSDWNKIDLDGSETMARVNRQGHDAFFFRIQAVSHSGPGVISDVVASLRDALPIKVYLEWNRETNVLDPNEDISIVCKASGRPRPSLQYVLSKSSNISAVEPDEWIPLSSLVDGEYVSGTIKVQLVSSRFLHCRASSSAGQNVSSLALKVNKPGDAPRNVNITQVDPIDILVEWEPPIFQNLPITNYELLVSDEIDDDEDNWQMYSTIRGNRLNRYALPTAQLKPSTKYFTRIRAVNDAGRGPLSTTVEFTTPNGGPEHGPRQAKVYINEANTVILSWEQPHTVVNITAFVIYFTRDPSALDGDYNSWQFVEVPPDVRKYKLDYQAGLKPKTLYRLRIVPKNEVAEGPPSDTVEFETAYQELPIPTDISVSLEEDNTATVTFTAVRDPQDHSKLLEEYKVELAQADDVLYARWGAVTPEFLRKTVDSATSTVTLTINGTQLQKNVKYWIRVRAISSSPGHHKMGSSKPRLFNTGDGKLTTKAELVGGATIRKDPNRDERLLIECRAEGSPAPTINWLWNGKEINEVVNQSITTVSTLGGQSIIESNRWGIKELREHRITVSTLIRERSIESGIVTCNASNDEGYAIAVTEVKILGPGSEPRNLSIYPYRNEMRISWLPPKLPNGEITKYIVYYTTTPDDDLSDWLMEETSDLNISIAAVAPLTIHAVRVQSISSDGPGIISSPQVAISDERYEPLVVNIVLNEGPEVSAGTSFYFSCVGKGSPQPSVFYKWEFGAEEPISTMAVENEEDAFISTAHSSTFQNRTLICKALNKYEEREAHELVIVRKPGDSPSNVIWSVQDDDTVKLTWDQITYPNGENLTYKLYLGNLAEEVRAPPVVLKKLPRAVNVSLQIAAVNEYGEGPLTQPKYFLTPSGAPRDPPIIRTIKSINNRVTVHWDPPPRPQGTIQWYTIYYCRSDESEGDWESVTVPAHVHTYTLDNSTSVQPETVYLLRMSARNENGEGPLSAIFSFDTFSVREGSVTISNVTATLASNHDMHVYLGNGKRYQNYLIYVREETKGDWWTFDVGNISSAKDTIVIHHIPLLPNKRYQLQICGIHQGREVAKSEIIELEIEFTPTTESPSSNNTVDPIDSLSEEKKRQLKEPPIFVY